jgi:hypothetical protein
MRSLRCLALLVGFLVLNDFPCVGQSPPSLLYPLVDAYYVGGSIPGLSERAGPLKGIPWYRQLAGLQVNQYRIPGRLTPGSEHLVFAFRWKRNLGAIVDEKDGSPPYELLNCSRDVFPGARL